MTLSSFNALAAALLMVGMAAGASQAQDDGLERFEFERVLMGSEFRIVLYGHDSSLAAAAANSAFAAVDSLNRIMSDYLPDSELNRVSAQSGSNAPITVSEDLWRVLGYAQRVAYESEGAFDVTVGPLTRLWRKAIRRGTPPDSADIREALLSVGYASLLVDSLSNDSERTVRLLLPGMLLDLGGIGKGFAVDRAFETLEAAGFKRILVDGGGDIRVGDPPPNQDGWSVGIAGMSIGGGRIENVQTSANTAIAVSGAWYRYLEHEGMKYSHILDPRTGYGMTDNRVVHVYAPTCMEADALASAFSVANREIRIKIDRLHPGISSGTSSH